MHCIIWFKCCCNLAGDLLLLRNVQRSRSGPNQAGFGTAVRDAIGNLGKPVGVWDLDWMEISYVMTVGMAEEQKDAATLSMQTDQGGEDWQGQMTLRWQDSWAETSGRYFPPIGPYEFCEEAASIFWSKSQGCREDEAQEQAR